MLARLCLEQGADLHMAQLMFLPLTVSCFSKIQIGFTFLVLAHPGGPGQRVIKQVLFVFVISNINEHPSMVIAIDEFCLDSHCHPYVHTSHPAITAPTPTLTKSLTSLRNIDVFVMLTQNSIKIN